LVDAEVKGRGVGRVARLALVAAEFALERLDFGVELVRALVVEELLNFVRLDGLVRRAVRVPTARMETEVRLGHAHEADITGAHDARCATDPDYRQ